MAGKKTAKEALDDREKQITGRKVLDAIEGTEMPGIPAVAKYPLQRTGIMDKDADYAKIVAGANAKALKQGFDSPNMARVNDAIGYDKVLDALAPGAGTSMIAGQKAAYAKEDAEMAALRAQALMEQAGAVVAPMVDSAKGAIQQGLLSAKGMLPQKQTPAPTPYEQEIYGQDMQPNDATRAFYGAQQKQAFATPAERAGMAAGNVIQAAKGIPGQMKGLLSQFSNGMSPGATAQQAQQGLSQAELQMQQIWNQMDPVQREMFLQEIRARQQGMQP